MLKSIRCALGAVALLVATAGIANATPIIIDYTLTPTSGGSTPGILELVLSSAPTATYAEQKSLISVGSKVTFGSEVFSLTSSNVNSLEFTGLASNYPLYILQLPYIHDTSGAGWLTMSSSFSFTSAAGATEAGVLPSGGVVRAAAAVAVPEPVTLSIFGAGLVGAAAMRRRKKKS